MFSVQIFEPTGTEVRSFVESGTGVCWFHAGGVAETLEFSNPYRYLPTVLEPHEYKEVSTGQGRPAMYVREEGVYLLIMKSKSIYASAFQRWLAYEVLPKIRKTGSFGDIPNDQSDGADFWMLIDGAIARGLEPKRVISLHQQFTGRVKGIQKTKKPTTTQSQILSDVHLEQILGYLGNRPFVRTAEVFQEVLSIRSPSYQQKRALFDVLKGQGWGMKARKIAGKTVKVWEGSPQKR